MPVGHVERVEVVPLGLELRTLGDLPAHCDEDVADSLLDRGQWMPRPPALPVGRQGDVDGLVDQDPCVAGCLQLGLASRQCVGDLLARAADALAGIRPGRRGQGTDFTVRQGKRRPVARMRDLDILERIQAPGGRDRSERVIAHPGDFVRMEHGDFNGVVGLIRCRHIGGPGFGNRTGYWLARSWPSLMSWLRRDHPKVRRPPPRRPAGERRL
jgi:hypothetical protein